MEPSDQAYTNEEQLIEDKFQELLNGYLNFKVNKAGLAKDGLEGKCAAVPTEVREKLTKTVSRIVNENRGGLICLLL